jgi:TolB-like protein/class 3 adenylate cyclase
MSGDRVERRLAAILAADVAGYSRLIGADEVGTLRALKTIRAELIDPKIADHRGRLVKTTGDGLLVEFGSVVDALRCATDVQRAMAERNSGVLSDERIEFRIGINMGDIVVEDGDIFGDGVNVAARLEGLAEPGGVCVAARVQEDAAGRLDLAFEDMGEQALRNIARPVRAYRVTLTHPAATAPGSPLSRNAGDGAECQQRGAGEGEPPLALPDKPSIAVLPFQNLSGDPEQEYFADGIVDDIITGLSRIRWLLVIARNSSFAHKGHSVDVKQIGRELGVCYALEGSVRRSANRVRITTQLIEAETGVHVRAERYDRSLDDIFAVQDEIMLRRSARSSRASGRPRSSVSSASGRKISTRTTWYCGRYPMPTRQCPSRRVLQCRCSNARSLEPAYGLAHGYLAFCFEVIFARGGLDSEIAATSVRHAHAAIAHGRDDATALGLAGFAISLVEHDQPAAIEAIEAALALSPSCSIALILGCVSMGWANEPKRALDWGGRAVRLSPFDPLIYAAHMGLAVGYFASRRFDEAVSEARRSVRANPEFSVGQLVLAASLAAVGLIPEAKLAAARVSVLVPNFTVEGNLLRPTGVPAALAPLFTTACHAAGLP